MNNGKIPWLQFEQSQILGQVPKFSSVIGKSVFFILFNKTSVFFGARLYSTTLRNFKCVKMACPAWET